MHSSRWLVQAVSNIYAMLQSSQILHLLIANNHQQMSCQCCVVASDAEEKQPTFCDFSKATATIRDPAL
jgi:hypothetical protein